MLKVQCNATVDPAEMYNRKLSDHSPVRLVISCPGNSTKVDLPIETRICKHKWFARCAQRLEAQ
eukprot:4120328-Karenia_brevis.AAC.1